MLEANGGAVVIGGLGVVVTVGGGFVVAGDDVTGTGVESLLVVVVGGWGVVAVGGDVTVTGIVPMVVFVVADGLGGISIANGVVAAGVALVVVETVVEAGICWGGEVVGAGSDDGVGIKFVVDWRQAASTAVAPPAPSSTKKLRRVSPARWAFSHNFGIRSSMGCFSVDILEQPFILLTKTNYLP